MRKVLGFYNYTVWLTYISLAISMIGITLAVNGRATIAILCLALSGLCDMFDGKIARTKKDRTEDEKAFGIQIDSLCDVICFGAFPAIFCWSLGVRGLFGMAAIVLYCVCGVIRLAYFNVLEGKRQQEEDGLMKCYHGLPITSISVILPILYVLRAYLSNGMFLDCLRLTLIVVGILFVIDFRFAKPKNKTLALLVGIVAGALFLIFCNAHRLEGFFVK